MPQGRVGRETGSTPAVLRHSLFYAGAMASTAIERPPPSPLRYRAFLSFRIARACPAARARPATRVHGLVPDNGDHAPRGPPWPKTRTTLSSSRRSCHVRAQGFGDEDAQARAVTTAPPGRGSRGPPGHSPVAVRDTGRTCPGPGHQGISSTAKSLIHFKDAGDGRLLRLGIADLGRHIVFSVRPMR